MGGAPQQPFEVQSEADRCLNEGRRWPVAPPQGISFCGVSSRVRIRLQAVEKSLKGSLSGRPMKWQNGAATAWRNKAYGSALEGFAAQPLS